MTVNTYFQPFAYRESLLLLVGYLIALFGILESIVIEAGLIEFVGMLV